jgi:hypothetical protein
MSLPEGFGHTPGRSRVKSIKLLAAARELGHEAGVVLTRAAGYDVPEDVLEKYLETADDDIEPSATRSDAFAPVQTNHEAFGFNTLHPDEAHNDDDVTTVDANAAQVGVGMQPSYAAGETPDADDDGVTLDDIQAAARVGLDDGADDDETDESDESDESSETDDESEDKAPAKSASKTEWLTYARTKGFEGDDDSITTKELIERFGA